MEMAGKKLSLEGLLAQAVSDRHSPLYIAMRDHHDAMVRAFENKRPDWSALVAGFDELGILDGDGKPPSVRGAQNTWARVKRDFGGKARHGAKPSPPPAPSVEAPPRPAPLAKAPTQPARPAPAFDPTEGADEATPTPTFGVSRVRRD